MTAVQNDPNRMHTDGTRAGDPIPGSKLYRAFCPVCGEPIRFAADSPEDAKRLAGGKHCNDEGNHFTPACNECLPPARECGSLIVRNDRIAESSGYRRALRRLGNR